MDLYGRFSISGEGFKSLLAEYLPNTGEKNVSISERRRSKSEDSGNIMCIEISFGDNPGKIVFLQDMSLASYKDPQYSIMATTLCAGVSNTSIVSGLSGPVDDVRADQFISGFKAFILKRLYSVA
jgi:hypothetical protein